ncbi:MAG: iron chelate uptake ABC transporter family permease subunit, partial [Sphingomonadaceae bacterium]|nr:iron chelate uptake ABC transporter family permease subunit [Sphingomonadaceae bacterium]
MRAFGWLALGLGVLALSLLSLGLPLGSLPALFESDPALATTILIELRLPRALLALAYGAILGASGAAIQALFANPLASPDITGATGGAALGAVVASYLIGVTGALGVAL